MYLGMQDVNPCMQNKVMFPLRKKGNCCTAFTQLPYSQITFPRSNTYGLKSRFGSLSVASQKVHVKSNPQLCYPCKSSRLLKTLKLGLQFFLLWVCCLWQFFSLLALQKIIQFLTFQTLFCYFQLMAIFPRPWQIHF